MVNCAFERMEPGNLNTVLISKRSPNELAAVPKLSQKTSDISLLLLLFN